MKTSHSFEIKTETFETLKQYEADDHIKWPWVFSLPGWVAAWWNSFGADYQPCLLSVHEKKQLIGLALMKQKEETLSFAGSADVCDYLDFVAKPGKETEFAQALMDYFPLQDITHLDLRCLRPDSFAANYLVPLAEKKGYAVTCKPDDVSFDVALPGTWDDFLMGLKSKQRHEVKRKLRRLHEAGTVAFDIYSDLHSDMAKTDLFFKLFTESREDKSDFMTSQMAVFFKDMIAAMGRAGYLKFGVLSLDENPVAVIIFFDFNNGYYLYNNGYDLTSASLSVGVLSKVLAIEHAIEQGRTVFDFLKGTEIYKTRLGGRQIDLSRCRVTLK